MRQFCLFAIFALFRLFAVSQTADFSYSTSSGLFCAPQVIKFTQNCSGSPMSFVWNFGNGKTGNHPVESIVYTNPGTYTIKLIAVYPNTAITVSKTIVIYPEPSITLTASKRNLCSPGPVSFHANGSAGTSSYQWNFGDGSPVQTTIADTITHNFASYDTFNIVVKAITASGCNAVARTTVKIRLFDINGAVNPLNGCVPVDAQFSVVNHLLPGDAVQSLQWDFNDGTTPVTGHNNIIHHTYTAPGTIGNANVLITTNLGCTNQYHFDSLKFGLPPTGTQAYTTSHRDTFCGSENVEFFAMATGASMYKWDFGDGATDHTTENVIRHSFNSLGNKWVVVTPLMNGCEGEKDSILVNICGVIARYSISNQCINRNNYFFANHSLGNISHFEWTFGDTPGFIDSVNLNTGHMFPPVGAFYTQLLLIDNTTGCRDTLKTNIYRAIPDLTCDKSAVCKDSIVVYQVNNDFPANSGYSYEFHVNGTIVDNGASDQLSFHPQAYGNFTDYVVIRDRLQGTCNDTAYVTGNVAVRGPVVDFTVPASLCFDSTLQLLNNSHPFYSGEPIRKWYWDFGNNQSDTSANPLPYQYLTAGTYTIKLTATDVNSCTQSTTRQIEINRLPHVDVLPGHDTICMNTSVTLYAYSSDQVNWSSGQAISCITCDTIIVTPQHSDNYLATVINSAGCRNYDSSMIKVYGPIQATVVPSDTSICLAKTVKLSVTPVGVVNWMPSTWLSDANGMNTLATPANDIHYRIIIKDSMGCYTDTVSANIHLRNNPVADAGPDKTVDYEEPFIIDPYYSAGIVLYNWTSAATINCSTCPILNAVALDNEKYIIAVEDSFGCKASDSIYISINCAGSRLMMPDAFTPNGDGVNDRFYPISRGYDIVRNFSIFDRNGNKVFERKDFVPNIASLGWDGTRKNGTALNTQTFIWMAELQCDPRHTVIKKGSVLLIR